MIIISSKRQLTNPIYNSILVKSLCRQYAWALNEVDNKGPCDDEAEEGKTKKAKNTIERFPHGKIPIKDIKEFNGYCLIASGKYVCHG